MGHQIGRHNNPKDYNYILDLFQSLAQNQLTESLSWTLVSWVDENNKLRVDARLGVLNKNSVKDVTKQTHIESAKEKPWEIKLSEPRKGNTSGKWIIPAAIGVADQNGKYIGSLIFGFDIEKLQKQFAFFTFGKNIKYALIDANHNIVLSSEEKLNIDNKILEGFDFYIPETQSFSHINLFSGNSVYAYKLNKLPYAIYLSYGDDVLWSGLGNSLRSNTFEILIAFIILAIMAVYFRKRIVLPIKELSDAAEIIAKNQTEIIIPRSSSYEMYSLAKALTRMKIYQRRDKNARAKIEQAYSQLEQKTQKLKESTEKLRSSNKELQNAKNRIEELMQIHKDSDKEKESFLRDMYHMLNTPLNAIINGADIARREMLGPLNLNTYKDYLDAMYDAGRQLKCFTTEFLYPEHLDIKDIIEKCSKIQKKYASDNGIELVCNIPDNIPKIFADKLRLRQVILSALYHSMYYVPKGRKTEIMTKLESYADGNPALLTIIIQDNGWGYEEKIREKFWNEKFGHEAESYSRNPDMMKLSLNTIKHFMRLHHGNFEIQAIPEKGSIFTITIPYLNKEELLIHPNDKPRESSTKPTKTNIDKNIIKFPDKKK